MKVDLLALDDTRRAMLATLGLACNHVHQGGFGDIEAMCVGLIDTNIILNCGHLNMALRLEC